MRLTKWTRLLALLAALVMVVAACSGSDPATDGVDDTDTTEASSEGDTVATDADYNADAETMGAYAGLDKDLSGVELKVATIGGAPYEAMYESISVFEDVTGASVEIVFLGDHFEVDRYMKTNYAAGTVDFDVAHNHTSFQAQYVNFVEPLNSYFSEEELAPFSDAIITSATIDGDLQYIGRHADISAMHYRLDLFEDPDLQAGFEAAYGYPLAPPASLDEMYDMAEFFVGEGVVQYGTEFAGKEEALNGRYYEILLANGGAYFDDDLKPSFDDEAGKASAQWMQDLYANGLIPADTPNLLWPEVAQNWCDGNVAFYLEWYGWYSYFQDPESCPAVAGNFGLVRGPVGSSGDIHTGWAGAHAFSVTKASENKEAAVQLVKFLTSERVLYEEALLGVLPVRDDVWARVISDAQASDVALDTERLEIAQVQIAEDFTRVPIFQDWIAFGNGWVPTLQAILLGDLTVDEGISKGVEDAEDLLDGLGYYDG